MVVVRQHTRLLLFYSAGVTMTCLVALTSLWSLPDCRLKAPTPAEWNPAALARFLGPVDPDSWLDCMARDRTPTSPPAIASAKFTQPATLPGSASPPVVDRIIQHDLNPLDTASSGAINWTHPDEAPLLLMLTPLKNAASQLDRYFNLLAGMSYPRHRTSLGFLVGDTDDDTHTRLLEHLCAIQHNYRRITVLRRDFRFTLPNGKRKGFADQGPRRSVMARARNHLLTGALRDEAWVLWRDVDLIEFPTNVVEQMMRPNHDVITVNCHWPWPDGTLRPYDLNAWVETPESIEWARGRDANELFLEGHSEMWTHRKHLSDFEHDKEDLVRLDAVGGTLLLVRAEVHRSGALFPPFIYKHQLETEGFGLVANDLGYSVYGMPHLKITHIYG